MNAFDHAAHSGTRRIVGWALLWSLAVTVAESALVSNIDTIGPVRFVSWLLIGWLQPMWWLTAALLLWAARRGERVAGVSGMIGALFIVSFANAALQPFVGWALRPLRDELMKGADVNLTALMPANDFRSWLDLCVYQMWIGLFYGGLLLLAYAFVSRHERMQRLLHQAAVARGRTETLLASERLHAQQAQIDPRLLVETMHEVETRYRSDPLRGDRLLSALVNFLQYAMPGLRERSSTVQRELQLADAYLRLQTERGRSAHWRIDSPVGDDALSRSFPSLLMLPLLALAEGAAETTVRVRVVAERLHLSLRGLARSPGDELQQRIRHALLALHGHESALAIGVHAPDEVEITIGKPHRKGEPHVHRPA